MLEVLLTSSASTGYIHAHTCKYLNVFACACLRSELVSGAVCVSSRMLPGFESCVHGRAGAMAHWPALQRWADPAYLLSVAGLRTVPVELGAHYLAPGWGQALMPFSAFFAAHLLAAPCPGSDSMAAHLLAEACPGSDSMAAHLLAEPCSGFGPTAADGAATAELGGQAKAQAGAASAAAAGGLPARTERIGGGAGAAAGSGLGAAAAQRRGRAAEAPAVLAQRGYLAQHDLFAQVRKTPPPGGVCASMQGTDSLEVTWRRCEWLAAWGVCRHEWSTRFLAASSIAWPVVSTPPSQTQSNQSQTQTNPAVCQQVPELARDIATPDYCAATGELRAVNAWLGPAGTVRAPPRTSCTLWLLSIHLPAVSSPSALLPEVAVLLSK